MSGVAILVALATADDALAALVSQTDGEPNMQAGVLPPGTPLPAIAFTSVSSVPRNVLQPGQTRHVTDRVQATTMAADYPTQKAVQKALERAAADFIGDQIDDLDGISRITVHLDAEGPDFMNEEASIYLGTRDFRVSYTESRAEPAS